MRDAELSEQRVIRDDKLATLFQRWPALNGFELRQLRQMYAERFDLASPVEGRCAALLRPKPQWSDLMRHRRSDDGYCHRDKQQVAHERYDLGPSVHPSPLTARTNESRKRRTWDGPDRNTNAYSL